MDLFDEVIYLEENAFKAGEEIGKQRAAEESKKMSFALGRDNGESISNEYGYIRGFTEIVDKEEHIRVAHEKLINSILSISITPTMPSEEINHKIISLRNLFKILLSNLKLAPHSSSSQDLF